MLDTYTPIDPDFEILVKTLQSKNAEGKIHYFDSKGEVADCTGVLTGLVKNDDGLFIDIQHQLIRLDKIITIFGKPGPAYELYNSYADACLSCYNPSED